VSGDGNSIDQSRTVNIYYGLPAEKPAAKRPDRNERTLIDAVWTEVDDRLRQSLYNAFLISLDMAEQRSQVSRPWDSELRTAEQKSKPLPSGTSIVEVFDRRDVGGKLLVLGNPGAGKTTTMLDLAAALVQRANADPDEPIPVMVNLSSWRDAQQSLTEYIWKNLKEKQVSIPKDLWKAWLKEKKIVPLLDGLDEIPPERQEAAVKAINNWLKSEEGSSRLLVCSCLEEYELYTTNLHLNGAICINPLTDDQIKAYLNSLKMGHLWNTLYRDTELLKLVRTPLLLRVSTSTNDAIDLTQLEQLKTTHDRRKYLLKAYISCQLNEPLNSKGYQPNQQPTGQQICNWLAWLAKQLEEQSVDEFSIPLLQSYVLDGQSCRWYYWNILFLLNFLIIASFIIMVTPRLLLDTHPISLTRILTSISFLCLPASFILTTQTKHDGANLIIYLISSPLRLFQSKSLQNLSRSVPPIHEIYFGARFRRSLPSIRDFQAALKQAWNSVYSFYRIPITSIPIIAIFLTLFHELIIYTSKLTKRRRIHVLSLKLWRKIHRNERLHQQYKEHPYGILIESGIEYDKFLRENGGFLARTALGSMNFLTGFFLFILLLIPTILGCLFSEEIKVSRKANEEISESLRIALLITLALVLHVYTSSKYDPGSFFSSEYFTFAFGFIGCLSFLSLMKHLSLRITLTFKMKVAPWYYARFLNHCTDRLLLQRVGGRYRFIHPLVQEHFAAMPLEK
jgi:hypothetical protein